jgi:hypothetical protein
MAWMIAGNVGYTYAIPFSPRLGLQGHARACSSMWMVVRLQKTNQPKNRQHQGEAD